MVDTKINSQNNQLERRRRGSAISGIITVVMVLAVLVGGYCFGNYRYRQGVRQGSIEAKAEIQTKLGELATLILERDKLSKVELNEINSENSFDGAGINNYLSKLDWMIENSQVAEVKDELTALRQSVDKFKRTYAESDAVVVLAEFNELKNQAHSCERKISEIYQTKIKQVLETL